MNAASRSSAFLIIAILALWPHSHLFAQGPQPGTDATLYRIVRHSAPKYPKQALKARVEGEVHAEIRILGSGTDAFMRVASIRIVSGNPVFAYSIAEAASKWTFEQIPNRGRGSLLIPVTIRFSLRPKPFVSDDVPPRQ